MTFISRIRDWVSDRLGIDTDRDGNGDASVPELDFKQRYHTFKLLLSANNRALEAMADMEILLNDSRPFGMSSVRGQTTVTLVNVFRMVRKLDMLAPGKYASLFDRFHAIQAGIETAMDTRAPAGDDRLLIPLARMDKQAADVVGGKMANLGELKNRLGMNVPRGFAITAKAHERFFSVDNLQAEINRRIQAADPDDIPALYTLSTDIQALIVNARVPDDLVDEIRSSVATMADASDVPLYLAMRSSAVGEDSARVSFAGQYTSLLNVSPDDVIQAYKQVVAGKYSLTAINYRMNRGFRDEDISMCVGCIAMVDAHASGVIYSHNPFDLHDDALFIHSTWGLPGPVVEGSGASDLFVVRRQEDTESDPDIIHTEIQTKETKYVCHPGQGFCGLDEVTEFQDQPSIESDTIRVLTKLTLEMEAHYGTPLDIEWAVTAPPHAEVFILQCRPLSRKPKSGGTNPVPAVSNRYPVVARGGATASPGAAAGLVYHVNTRQDLLRFPDGAVLVAPHALARWASVLNRASAVVTEQGSFAGHLANVAREFGVPALFNLKKSTDMLVPGTEVTVDADNGVVYGGRVETLLNVKTPKANLMKDSPVYTILKDISRQTIPLNLLDPDDIGFKPENCETLHDITRFVHEKSVHEMFSFGKRHGIAHRSAKQLFDRVPMQWWILNLDDGFTGEVSGKHVCLDEIASIPMLAMWEGITAFPWDGPPPIDTRGFMSVMFRATTNTALNTGQRSKYAERNFFIISKEYCSLSSRLGFHFTTMEAFAGRRPQENYISFRFQGGAADYDRRLSRVRFISTLLSEYGFDTIIKQDNLQARIKGGDETYVLSRLRVLGYLTIHTRQLDMVIANKNLVRQYRSRFKRDIDTILNPNTDNRPTGGNEQ